MSRPILVLFKQGAYTGSENKTQSSQPVLIHFEGMLGDMKWQKEEQRMADRSQQLDYGRKMSRVHLLPSFALLITQYYIIWCIYMYTGYILLYIYSKFLIIDWCLIIISIYYPKMYHLTEPKRMVFLSDQDSKHWNISYLINE